jgi:hypothetical protein
MLSQDKLIAGCVVGGECTPDECVLRLCASPTFNFLTAYEAIVAYETATIEQHRQRGACLKDAFLARFRRALCA